MDKASKDLISSEVGVVVTFGLGMKKGPAGFQLLQFLSFSSQCWFCVLVRSITHSSPSAGSSASRLSYEHSVSTEIKVLKYG